MHTCVACGEIYEGDNHHCDPKRENKIESGRNMSAELGIERHPSWSERLSNGFKMARRAGAIGLLLAIIPMAALGGEDSHVVCPALESPRHPILDRAAQRHADNMAAVCEQGHQGWEYRIAYLQSKLGPGQYAEICAESWEWQRDCSESELWAEMVRCWKQSPGHWRTASRKHAAIGAAMSKGRNGVFYACLIAYNGIVTK